MARPAASMKRPAAAEPLDLSSPPRKATATEVPTNPDSMGFKSGPRKLEELLSWADEAVAYILADPGSIWLQNLTERGVCIGSHFSGLMTAEVALEQLVRATKAQMPEIDVRGKLIDAWTCDTAPECLEIALNYDFDPQIWAPRRIGQRLVFSNILDAFSDGARQHVDKYHNPAGAIHRMKAHYVKGLKRVVPVLHGSSDELVIADLEQNPGFGPAAGNMIPTLVTHGLIHSFTRLRPLVPLEHLVAMGFNVFHPLHGKELAVKTGLKNCSPAELKRMAGNAMYLPLVGVQILYLLSYVHRKPPVPERRSSSSSLATMRTDGSPELWRRMRSFFSSPAPSQDQDTQDVESRSSVR